MSGSDVAAEPATLTSDLCDLVHHSCLLMNGLFPSSLLIFAILSIGSACKVQDVQSTSYTTTDGLVISHVALIANFSLICEKSAASDNLLLYAEVPTRKIVPVTRSLDGKSYQVSWTEEVAKASYGDRNVRIFDEAGLAAIEKAQETGSSSDSVQPLLSLTVNHRGTYRGPLIPMELVAVLAVVLVWYTAYSAKLKLTA